MEPGWYIGKRFWQSMCGNRLVIDTLSRNASLGNLVRPSTGEPVAKSEDFQYPCLSQSRLLWSVEVKNNSNTEFSKETVNHEFFLPAEGAHPQNYIADQQRLQLSDKFPTPSTFSCWKLRFETQVSASFRSPSEAMSWIKEVGMVDSVDVS